MKNKIFVSSIQQEFLAFDAIFKRAAILDNSRTRTITFFLKNLTESSNMGSAESIEEIDSFITSLEKLLDKVKLAKEKYKIELVESKEDNIKRLRENDKQYTTTSAGIYIATQLNRKSPVSRAQVNNYINDGKLSSHKTGSKNYIYESDIDKFIEKYKDTLRGVFKN